MTKYTAKKPDKNGLIHFTEEENETWNILIKRQINIVQPRACAEYLKGLDILDMPHDRIPQCNELSEKLNKATGWSVVPVDAIIPLEKFFSLLAHRQFPAAAFIRIREELDYLQEPDIFHEYFGHCPMLTHPSYADFVQWYGVNALKADKKTQSLLGRLFWFTVEFGLLQTEDGLKIYGGGILSSFEETIYALENPVPERLPFDLHQILNTDYRYDEIQKRYYILKNLSQLFQLKSDGILQLVASMSGKLEGDDFITC